MSRETAWSNWNEWHHAKKLFFSNKDGEILKAMELVKMWKSRIRTGSLPVSVDLTSTLFAAKMQLDESDSESKQQALLCGAMALVRFVNGITDQFQTGFYAQPVQNIADKIYIPEWMVELRHEITHGQLPSLDLVKSGLMFSLNWLFQNYWQETASKIDDQNETLHNSFVDSLTQYAVLVFESVSNMTPEAPSETKREKKKANKNERERETIVQNLLKIINHGNLSTFVNSLTNCSGFILDHHKLVELNLPITVNDDLCDDQFQVLDHLAHLWKSLSCAFQEKFPHFIELLLENLTTKAKNRQKEIISILFAVHLSSPSFVNIKVLFFVISLLMKNPSGVSFQILAKQLSDQKALSTEVQEILKVFLTTFQPAVHLLNKKSPGVVAEKDHVFTKVIEKLTEREEALKSKSTGSSNSNWNLLSDQELCHLPPMGEFKSGDSLHNLDTRSRILKVLSLDDLNIPNKKSEISKNCHNPEIVDVIDGLFDQNGYVYVLDDDSESESCPTEGYTEDAEMSWFADEEEELAPNKVDFEIEEDSPDHKTAILKSRNLYANTVDVSKLTLF